MNSAIIEISGIGPAAAETLDEHDIKSLADLASAPVEKVSAVPGFSEAGATRVIAAAAELLAAPGETQPPEGNVKKSGKKDKAAGKGKKGKKDKKKKSKGKGKGTGKKKGKK